jgi:chromatin segregation and condensation protein Rec8/ScpA/Scc1 (kleisin family)
MESEKSKSKKKAQRKTKKPIVVKVKRKRDETPEQALVIEQRITKKTKVNFLDSFKNMTLAEKSPEDQTFASMLCFVFLLLLNSRNIFSLFWNRQ